MAKDIRRCQALYCENTNLKCDLSFFGFPKDPNLLKKWLENIEMKPLSRKVSYLCSDHFDVRTFSNTFKRRLLQEAVPTFQKPSQIAKAVHPCLGGCSSTIHSEQQWTDSTALEDSEKKYKKLCSAHIKTASFSDTFQNRLIAFAVPVIQKQGKEETSKDLSTNEDVANITKPKDSFLHTSSAKATRRDRFRKDTWLSAPFAYLYTNHVEDDFELLEESQKLCSTAISDVPKVLDSISGNKSISSATKTCGELSPKNATFEKTVNSSVKPSSQCSSAEGPRSQQCDEVTLLNKKLADVEARLEFANEKLLEARRKIRKKNLVISSLLEELMMQAD